MRLRFHNIEQPKRIAKCLAKHLCIQLSACQNEVAKSAGYRDWHELFNSITLEVSTDLFEDIDVETQAETIVSLANALGADTGDVQFALTEAGAFKALRQSYHHQLALRALCFRLTTIPDQGSRQPGSVGFVKPWKEYVILREFRGQYTYFSHHPLRSSGAFREKHAYSRCPENEYTVPRIPCPPNSLSPEFLSPEFLSPEFRNSRKRR